MQKNLYNVQIMMSIRWNNSLDLFNYLQRNASTKIVLLQNFEVLEYNIVLRIAREKMVLEQDDLQINNYVVRIGFIYR